MLFRNIGRYHKIGYKANPFIGLTDEEFVSIFPLEEDVAQMLKGCSILQVLGSSGAGKTSLLLQICRHLKENQESFTYFYITNSLPPHNLIYNKRWILLDEAQRISQKDLKLHLQKWIKDNKKIVLSTHIFLKNALEGFKFKNINMHNFHPKIIHNFVKKRLSYFAIEKPKHTFSKEAITLLLSLCGNSIEWIRAVCYEIFLQENVPHTIEKKDILMGAKKVKESLQKENFNFS